MPDRKPTGRERLRTALDHKDGPVPVDFGATAVTGMHVSCVDGLRKHYGLKPQPVKVYEPYQMLGWIDDDLAEAIGIDTLGIMPRTTMFGFETRDWKPHRLHTGLDVLVPGGFTLTYDAKGNAYLHPDGDLTAPPSGRMPRGGFYFDAVIRQPPLDEDHLNVEDNLQEFEPVSERDLAYQQTMLEAAQSTGRGIVTGLGGTALGDIALVPAVQLKHPRGIRDVEEWYVSLAARRDFVYEIFERQTEIALQNLRAYAERIDDMPDVVYVCGTDFGTQSGTFCSEKTFRDLYMPFYKRINGWIHENTGWKTFKHSCGAVAGFIPLFIESGFDILNPVQCSCVGMDPETLKREFGRDLTFWGGGVDTQRTFPFGTAQEVRRQVLSRLEIFSKGGGYVFNAIHNIQYGTPIENIVAMIDAVKAFNA